MPETLTYFALFSRYVYTCYFFTDKEFKTSPGLCQAQWSNINIIPYEWPCPAFEERVIYRIKLDLLKTATALQNETVSGNLDGGLENWIFTRFSFCNPNIKSMARFPASVVDVLSKTSGVIFSLAYHVNINFPDEKVNVGMI